VQTVVDTPLAFDGVTRTVALRDPPGRGENTRGLLEELGYTTIEIDDLFTTGAVVGA
jgi:crotonobetainyl-CoA:carnitine CoA-transferase CaiB-like acyl-CoA transferase